MINVYFINQIENKKIAESYLFTYGVWAVLFVSGVYYTPLAVEYKAFNKIEALEKVTAEIKVDSTGQISIPVESEPIGYELAKFLYLESAEPDSAGQSLFVVKNVDVLGFSNKDTSYYNLVFDKNSTVIALWLRSYNKKKKILDF